MHTRPTGMTLATAFVCSFLLTSLTAPHPRCYHRQRTVRGQSYGLGLLCGTLSVPLQVGFLPAFSRRSTSAHLFNSKCKPSRPCQQMRRRKSLVFCRYTPDVNSEPFPHVALLRLRNMGQPKRMAYRTAMRAHPSRLSWYDGDRGTQVPWRPAPTSHMKTPFRNRDTQQDRQ